MLKEYLSNIADKFRTHLDTTETINAQDFAGKIEDVAVKYNLSGFANGREVGYNQGLEEGIEQGKQAEYDRFWNIFQNNGNRTNYDYAFAEDRISTWSKGINPKYPIVPKSIEYCFYGFTAKDFSEFCANNKIDLSQCGSMRCAFDSSTIEKMPPFKASGLYGTFQNCYSLETIEDIGTTLSGNIFTGQATNTFANCTRLVNLHFSCIINAVFNFSNCSSLSYESLKNIKEQLKDNSGSTAKTITFGSTNLAKFTEEDKAEMEAKGWTVK